MKKMGKVLVVVIILLSFMVAMPSIIGITQSFIGNVGVDNQDTEVYEAPLDENPNNNEKNENDGDNKDIDEDDGTEVNYDKDNDNSLDIDENIYPSLNLNVIEKNKSFTNNDYKVIEKKVSAFIKNIKSYTHIIHKLCITFISW